MDSEKRLVKAKVRLLTCQPWFGQLASYLYLIETNSVGTAGINERGDFFYNPEFIKRLSDAELTGLLCHEVLHLAFQHPFRVKNRNPILWNIAADIKVNDELRSVSFIELPPGGISLEWNHEWNFGDVTISDIDQKTSEQIYDELDRKVPKFQVRIQFKGKGKNRKVVPDCSGLSEPWKGLVDRMVKDLLESSGVGEVKPGEVKKFRRQWQDRVNAANEALKGDVPLGLKRELAQLENPELPWPQILRQRFREKAVRRTWKRANKKWLPFYFPGRERRKGLNAVVAIDTSGSMSREDITKAISEVWGMAMAFQSFKFHIIFNDAEVWDIVEVTARSREKIRRIVPKGGGGTDFRPVFRLVEKKFKSRIDCLVFFTDGYGDFPSERPNYDVYWVTQSNNVKWPFGSVLRLRAGNHASY